MARSEVFRVALSRYHVFVGRIQGSGGFVAAEAKGQREQQLLRLRSEVERATTGSPLTSIYEPRRGCCLMELTENYLPRVVHVPLAGATIEWDD